LKVCEDRSEKKVGGEADIKNLKIENTRLTWLTKK
jgi:hypothetical protein